MQFSPLYVARLTVNASYAVNESVISLATPVRAELGAICAVALDQLTDVTTQFGQSINQNQKSIFTAEMKALDKERDADCNLIFRIDNNYLKGTDAELKMAASTLQLFLTPYKGLPSQPIDVQTRVTKEMLAKYNSSPELKQAAAKLGIDKAFTSLEAKNNTMAARYEARNEEYASQAVSGTSLKPAANAALIQFCSILEQTANLMPNNTILALFNKIDELRKKYHALESGGEDKTDTTSTDDTTK